MKKFILTLMLLLSLFSTAAVSQAATTAKYIEYVKKDMVPSLGTASTGTKYKAETWPVGGWCKNKGVLSVYAADFNNDKKKEAAVVYLKSDVKDGTGELHLVALSSRNGKMVKSQDISLFEIGDGDGADIKVYVKSYKGKKYLAVQNYDSGVGYYDNGLYVFSMNKNGKLCGTGFEGTYAGEIGMAFLNSNKYPETMSDTGHGVVSTRLLEKYSHQTLTKAAGYKTHLVNGLKPYGIEVSAHRNDYWCLKKNSNMLLISSIETEVKNGRYITVYKDASDFRKPIKNGDKVVKIRLDRTSVTLNLTGAKTVTLKAMVTGSSQKVKWSSSNKKVATVSASGRVTAKKAGKATITAVIGGKSAKCIVTVKNGSGN